MGRRRQGGETTYDMTVTERAFTEDKAMIEAQQQNIEPSPERRFVPTAADRGNLLFNRLIERMARAEAARAGTAADRKADAVRP